VHKIFSIGMFTFNNKKLALLPSEVKSAFPMQNTPVGSSNIVSNFNTLDGYLDVQKVQSSPQPLPSESATAENKPLKQPDTPFQQYFDAVSTYDHKFGEPEPLGLRYVRPFLLSTDIIPSQKVRSRRMKTKTKNGKSIKRNNNNSNEIYKSFTLSNPIPRPMVKDTNKVYKVQQDQVISLGTVQFGSQGFQIAMLDNYTSFLAIFDQYRIDMIEAWIYTGQSGVTSVSSEIFFCTVVDYDDSIVPSSFGQLEDYQNNLTTQTTWSHYRKFIPHVAVATYSGSFVSFGNVENQWIDSSSPAVLHYGLKFAYNNSTPITTVANYRFHVSYRQTR
jgi:hypothetical protein